MQKRSANVPCNSQYRFNTEKAPFSGERGFFVQEADSVQKAKEKSVPATTLPRKCGPFGASKKGIRLDAFLLGGDKRDRTADLLTASQALSQLSYTPRTVPFGTRIIIARHFLKVNIFFAIKTKNRKIFVEIVQLNRVYATIKISLRNVIF